MTRGDSIEKKGGLQCNFSQSAKHLSVVRTSNKKALFAFNKVFWETDGFNLNVLCPFDLISYFPLVFYDLFPFLMRGTSWLCCSHTTRRPRELSVFHNSISGSRKGLIESLTRNFSMPFFLLCGVTYITIFCSWIEQKIAFFQLSNGSSRHCLSPFPLKHYPGVTQKLKWPK